MNGAENRMNETRFFTNGVENGVNETIILANGTKKSGWKQASIYLNNNLFHRFIPKPLSTI